MKKSTERVFQRTRIFRKRVKICRPVSRIRLVHLEPEESRNICSVMKLLARHRLRLVGIDYNPAPYSKGVYRFYVHPLVPDHIGVVDPKGYPVLHLKGSIEVPYFTRQQWRA